MKSLSVGFELGYTITNRSETNKPNKQINKYKEHNPQQQTRMRLKEKFERGI